MSNISRRNFMRGTAAVGVGLAAAAVIGSSAQANVSIHAQARVSGFWPEYRGVCPCGWHGSWGSKNHAGNQVDIHKINNGVSPDRVTR